MDCEWKRYRLALAAVLVTLVAVVALRPSQVRAAGTYQLVEGWAQLPAGVQWGVMTAVDVDAKGNVYAFQREPTPQVMVFDASGKYLKTWGQSMFEYPHGLRVLRDGFVWTADRKSQQALKFDGNGTLLMSLGQKDVAGDNESTTAFNGVSDVAMGANGDIFVSDGEGGNTRVVKFSKDGKFIKAWGTKGAGPGELSGPHCIATDSKGRVWVCDRGNKRLEVFDQDGKYLDQMVQFGAPVSVAFGRDDLMYVATQPENRVMIATIDGKILETIEGLVNPHEIAVDSTGALYVAESAGKSVKKYVRK
jgi:DNA-binding beta-propeller fold protein YncE